MLYSDILLHTHLEGSVTYETLKKICIRNSIKYNERTFYTYLKKTNKIDWGAFREIFSSICSSFENRKDYFDLVVDYGKKLKLEGINIAEFHFSPWKHLERGICIEEIECGIFDGLKYLENNYDFLSCLIVDFVRKEKEDTNYIMDWVKSSHSSHIKAIGVSGGIPSVERKNYSFISEQAKNIGLKVVAHAGEIEPPSSILDAIQCLKPNRISHGINCVYDQNIMSLIKEYNIHLEICPTANSSIGVVDGSFNEIKLLLINDISFSINTDDELIFDTNLKMEYDKLYTKGIIDSESVLRILKNTRDHSFILKK